MEFYFEIDYGSTSSKLQMELTGSRLLTVAKIPRWVETVQIELRTYLNAMQKHSSSLSMSLS